MLYIEFGGNSLAGGVTQVINRAWLDVSKAAPATDRVSNFARSMMKHYLRPRYTLPAAFSALLAALVAGCSSRVPLPPMDPPPRVGGGAGTTTTPTEPRASAPVTAPRNSGATSVGAYRSDAASHLYGLNQERIYKGRLPPLLYAIGTLQVEVDRGGNVRNLNWMRAPKHAPEVVAEIERTIRAASPFPAPVRMGKAVYTETWLWHESGRFQLHTLTEGQD